MDQTATKRRLFALLVGINSYEEQIQLGEEKVHFPKLYSCVPDMMKVRDYLAQDSAFDCYIETLSDKEASKQNLVKLFHEHLGKAKENDVVFFYFSGHGTQEICETNIFHTESDGKLESIACYYDQQTKNDFLLADKELRWLINQVAKNKPHILTVFDCCHSGGNTRNLDDVGNNFQQVIQKQVPYTFPQRAWDSFIFSNHISKEEFASTDEDKILPEGFHFQFSACEANESAVEINGESVFTKTLLTVIRKTSGNLSYHELMGRIRQYMRAIYEQTPTTFIGAGNANDIFRGFLNKDIGHASTSIGEVTYNRKNGWQLNLGAIHGVTTSLEKIELRNANKPKTMVQATVRDIFIDYTQLALDKEVPETELYRAEVQQRGKKNLKLHITDEAGALRKMVSKLGSMFSMEEDEWSADYVFRRLHGMIYLTAPGDPYRPVCTALKENDDQLSSRLTIILRQIAQWEFLRSFRAPGEIDDSFYKSLRIEYSTGPGNMPYKFLRSNAGIKVNYEKKDNKWIAAIRVRLTNTSDVDLYCACLYLSSDFGSYSKFLAEPVTRIEPGRSIDLRFKGDTRIPVGFDPVMKWYNKNSNSDCFQFLVSEELFDTSFLDFKPLPGPAIPQKFKNRSERNAVTFSLRIPSQKKNRWFSRRVDMEIYNPEYNSIQPLELEAMLEDPETSCFAQGLYLRKAKDKYELKKSIRQEETNAAALERIIDQYNTAQPAKDRIIC